MLDNLIFLDYVCTMHIHIFLNYKKRLHFVGPINNVQHAMQILCIAMFNYTSSHTGILSLAKKFSIFPGDKNKIQES